MQVQNNLKTICYTYLLKNNNDSSQNPQRFCGMIPKSKWSKLCCESLRLYEYLLKIIHYHPERCKCNEVRFSYGELSGIFPPAGKSRGTIIKLINKLEQNELVHRIRYAGNDPSYGSKNITIHVTNQNRVTQFV